MTPLDRAGVASYTDPGQPGGQPGHPAVEIGTPVADGQASTSYPLYVATPELLRLYRLDPAAVAADTDVHPLTQQELATAQNLAASAGLTVESRRERASLGTLRTGAVAAGALLALGILAMTVGLIRGETAGGLRTLAATGAPRRVRRTLTATTAGALALLGAILGLAGAYLGLVSVLHRDLGALTGVPVAHLAATTVGLPVVAAVAGWLLAGHNRSR
ncbi:hypothetical protein [Micromonospora sp. ATA51]|uniref:hypothetical protein n=1 Tax=Micromonospora sp. ATA51 TaxID=2806098 RepID=UPI001A54423C|nr:hypothetical protein [Micromonospora sp. ATA51]MBM0224324.1 hypothetical protein [Micromonospora sp. ATA51]